MSVDGKGLTEGSTRNAGHNIECFGQYIELNIVNKIVIPEQLVVKSKMCNG